MIHDIRRFLATERTGWVRRPERAARAWNMACRARHSARPRLATPTTMTEPTRHHVGFVARRVSWQNAQLLRIAGGSAAIAASRADQIAPTRAG